MSNGSTEQRREAATVRVGWGQLRRVTSNRTSKPTDRAIRRLIGKVDDARGHRPIADTIILAALKILDMQQEGVLLLAVDNVESDTYEAHDPHGDPGEPDAPSADPDPEG